MNLQFENEPDNTSTTERKPKVSVCVVTYNQEKYIGKCLQSLVDQKTGFEFEVIVGDDCSTDGTRDIVRAFQEKYPNLIFPIYHKINIGPVDNLLKVYRAARGKYICHMDGDDYALDGKLQSQYDILEKYIDCVICSHDVLVVNGDGKVIRSSYIKHKKGISDIMDLYSCLPFFVHSSKMFRNDLTDDYWRDLHPKTLDTEIHVQQAKKGLIYHLHETLGVYREGVGITWTYGKKVNPDHISADLRILDDAIRDNEKYKKKISDMFARKFLGAAYRSALFGDSDGVRRYSRLSLKTSMFSAYQVFFLLLSFAPWTLIVICRTRSFIKHRLSFASANRVFNR